MDSLSAYKEYAKKYEEYLEALWLRDIISLFEDRFLDFEFIGKLWSSMTNTDWFHSRDIELDLSWTFRSAGAICTVLHGLLPEDYKSYLEWYHLYGAGNVDSEIGAKMKELGWTYIN